MNSNNLLTTVFRNLQWARRKRGYCPTTYMMLEAMMALLSLPRFCSHSPRRSCLKARVHKRHEMINHKCVASQNRTDTIPYQFCLSVECHTGTSTAIFLSQMHGFAKQITATMPYQFCLRATMVQVLPYFCLNYCTLTDSMIKYNGALALLDSRREREKRESFAIT